MFGKKKIEEKKEEYCCFCEQPNKHICSFCGRNYQPEISADCGYCRKTDFVSNMVEGLVVYSEGRGQYGWMHEECNYKARGIIVCPHCKGVGEVPIEKEGECVQGIK